MMSYCLFVCLPDTITVLFNLNAKNSTLHVRVEYEDEFCFSFPVVLRFDTEFHIHSMKIERSQEGWVCECYLNVHVCLF